MSSENPVTMEIDFLAVSHSINSNVKQTGAWLVANRDTENIFNLLFTYSDLKHLMIDDDRTVDPEGKTCRPYRAKTGLPGKSHRSDNPGYGPASKADPPTILYFRESCTEFLNSFKLAESAFYRYSFAALHNALEAGIMSVISQDNAAGQESPGDTGQTLRHLPASELIGKLKSLSFVKEFSESTDIIDNCRELHKELTALSGGKDAGTGLGRDVPPVSAGFDEKVFIRWTVCLRKTIRLLFTLFVLKYPVALLHTPVEKKFSTGSRGGPFLNSEERESLIELIDADDLELLMKVSKADPFATHLAAEINSCPDIIEEEFKRQLENFGKELKKKTTGKTGGP